MASTSGEGVDDGVPGGRSTLRKSYERVPRGRCQPPVTPTPNPRRGEYMTNKNIEHSSANRASRRHPSQVVMMSKGAGDTSRRPMPKWKRGYVGFKRKVKSSALVPLMLVVSVCGAGVHVTGLTGLFLGYFTWSVGCEGVVTVTGDSGRANGVQTYSLGWARYEGKGPSTASDSPTLPVNTTNDNNNGTIGSDLGKGGVAGSSIPEEGWLLAIDVFSAGFGALTAVGHLVGFAFYAAALFFAQRLFRCQFRSDRCLFRPAMKWASSLLVWMIGMAMLGFYLSARESFTGSVLTILHSEGFLCQDNKNLDGKFSYIATSFGCVASALIFVLTWWFGEAADLALSDSFKRRQESLAVASPSDENR